MEKRGPRAITGEEKIIMVQNFSHFQQHSQVVKTNQLENTCKKRKQQWWRGQRFRHGKALALLAEEAKEKLNITRVDQKTLAQHYDGSLRKRQIKSFWSVEMDAYTKLMVNG